MLLIEVVSIRHNANKAKAFIYGYFKNKNYMDLIQLKILSFPKQQIVIMQVTTNREKILLQYDLFCLFVIRKINKLSLRVSHWIKRIKINKIIFRYGQGPCNCCYGFLCCLCQFIISNNLRLNLNKQSNPAFDFQNLTDQKKKVDQFFRNSLSLDGYTLSDNQEQHNVYSYQYISGDVPITLENFDGDLEITNVISNQIIPTESSSIISSVSARSLASLDDAIKQLSWS